MTVARAKTNTTGVRKVPPTASRPKGGYEARISLGMHPARRCAECSPARWYWAGEGYPLRCDCGGELGPEVQHKLQRSKAFARKPDAEHWRNGQLVAHRNGVSPFTKPEPSKVSVASFAETYLATREGQIDSNTWVRYRRLLDQLCEVVGNVALDELTAAQVRTALAELQRGRKPATVRQAKVVLSGMLKRAVQDGLVETNVARDITVSVKASPVIVPAYEDVMGLLDHCTGHDEVWRLPFAIAIATGARRGEVLGLLRRNITFTAAGDGAEQALLTIDGVLRWDRKAKVLERRPGAKTAASTATITVEWAPAVTLLRAALNRPPNINPEADLICADDAGHWPSPDAFGKTYKRIATKAGLDPRTTLHGIRHSVATYLAEQGESAAVIARQLRHADGGALAMRVYIDGTDKLQQRGASVLAKATRSA